MKSLKIGLAFAASLFSASLFAQAKTETIKVSGNCGQCKKHIEKAAKLPGVETAVWDKKTKELTLVYDQSKVSTDKIEKSIADAGYDNEKFKAPDKAYSKLDECCQYDRAK
jgi:periplasmic mercuric ion binding protein